MIFKITLLSEARNLPCVNSKLKMMNILLTLVLLLASPTQAKAQATTLHYNVLNNEKNIGTLVISKKQQGELTEYHSKNSTKISRIATFNVDHELVAVFRNDQLESSLVTVHVNGNLREKTRIECKGAACIMTEKSGQETQIKGPIKATAINLYFNEPQNDQMVLSEQFGNWQTIEAKGPAEYELHRQGKKNNILFYENGIMTSSELGTSWINTRLELVKVE